MSLCVCLCVKTFLWFPMTQKNSSPGNCCSLKVIHLLLFEYFLAEFHSLYCLNIINPLTYEENQIIVLWICHIAFSNVFHCTVRAILMSVFENNSWSTSPSLIQLFMFSNYKFFNTICFMSHWVLNVQTINLPSHV